MTKVVKSDFLGGMDLEALVYHMKEGKEDGKPVFDNGGYIPARVPQDSVYVSIFSIVNFSPSRHMNILEKN